MNQDYIKPDNWSIIEEGFDAERVKSSESLFSIGNGAQRANFEEKLQRRNISSSIAVYIIQIKQSWLVENWISKNILQKVLNAPNWIGINVTIDGENLDPKHVFGYKNFVAN
jgi:maltose phosphorylase